MGDPNCLSVRIINRLILGLVLVMVVGLVVVLVSTLVLATATSKQVYLTYLKGLLTLLKCCMPDKQRDPVNLRLRNSFLA